MHAKDKEALLLLALLVCATQGPLTIEQYLRQLWTGTRPPRAPLPWKKP